MSMRMRKKRNFETRMDACKDLLLARGAGGILNMKEAAENYRDLVDFSKVFGNNRPVELEIGCGKGGFICELAARNKGVNYLALEKMSNVVLTPMEEVKKLGLGKRPFSQYPRRMPALLYPRKFPRSDIPQLFDAASQAGLCDARLTHRNFLEIYKKLLKKGGHILQKTEQ